MNGNRIRDRLIWSFVFAGLCLFALPGVAVQPDEVLADAGLEQRARALSAGLRCVVCQNQSIDDSDAPLAGDLRRLVRERLVAGDTDDEVMTHIVSRYGEYVLLKPQFGAHTALLWLLPFIVLGLAILFMFLRGRQGATAQSSLESRGSSALSEDEQQRLSQLLTDDSSRPVAKE